MKFSKFGKQLNTQLQEQKSAYLKSKTQYTQLFEKQIRNFSLQNNEHKTSKPNKLSIFDDGGLINNIIQHKVLKNKPQNLEQRSSLSHLSQQDRDMQKFVDQQHIIKQGKMIMPFMIGDMYTQNFLDKWFRKKEEQEMKGNDQEQAPVGEKANGQEVASTENDEDDDDDYDFDDWRGVKRQGDSEEERNEDDDDNDGSGGVMMPVPDAF